MADREFIEIPRNKLLKQATVNYYCCMWVSFIVYLGVEVGGPSQIWLTGQVNMC